MSREPHPPLRRLSMLIVAVLWISVGVLLVVAFWPDAPSISLDEPHRHRSLLAEDLPLAWVLPMTGGILTLIGARFIVTALTPYRRRTQEVEDAEGEYPYTLEDRVDLRQWGDG